MSMKNFGRLQRNGFTLIDLFAAIFVLTIPSIVFNFSKPRLGLWWGILTGQTQTLGNWGRLGSSGLCTP